MTDILAPVGSKTTHQVTRRKLRRRLEAQGVDPAEIDRRVEERRREQASRRAGAAPKPRRSRMVANGNMVGGSSCTPCT